MQSSTLSDEDDNKDEGRLDSEGRRLQSLQNPLSLLDLQF